MDNMKKPHAPKFKMNVSPPSLRELLKIVKGKRNGAKPGFNGLPYIPYKKCIAIMKTIHAFFVKVWKTGEIPESWALAYIALLQKSDNLDHPGEFRPIAITNTIGKLFFSVLSNRLQFFMLDNEYIDRKLQKGFLSGVSGCIEHSFTLWEAFKDAKEEQRQIIVSWIWRTLIPV